MSCEHMRNEVCLCREPQPVGKSTAPYTLKGPRDEAGWRSVSSGGSISWGCRGYLELKVRHSSQDLGHGFEEL